jgi:hypothetical protein
MGASHATAYPRVADALYVDSQVAFADPVTIELLYFDGCANHARLLERLPSLLDRAAVTTELTLRRINDAADAERERFLGSPTLRVDGCDVEPGADDRRDYGLTCRIYRTAGGPSGLPDDEWIIAAISRREQRSD